jgi:ABC-type transport system involved in multi-copper enzyme maturation permease subunit
MISWNYIANLIRQHRGILIFAFTFLCLFQLLILTLVTEVDFLAVIRQVYDRMPPQMQFLFGEEFLAQFSINGIAGFGYNHPLVLIMFSIVAILLPSRYLAGEIESGTLGLLFSMPVRRLAIAFSLWLFMGAALIVLVAGCWAGTSLGMVFFPETHQLFIWGLVYSGINLWMLMMAIGSYTFLISSFLKEGGKATLRAVAVTMVFYFLNFVVKIWPKIDFLEPFSVFHYYQPQELMMKNPIPAENIIVLAFLILLCSALGFRQVSRRDVPG